jgi:hypothetical protein
MLLAVALVCESEEVGDGDRGEFLVVRLTIEFLAPEDVAEGKLESPVADGRADSCGRNEDLFVNAGTVLESVAVECDTGVTSEEPCAGMSAGVGLQGQICAHILDFDLFLRNSIGRGRAIG